MTVPPGPTQTSARRIVTMALRDSGYLALGQTAPAQITNEAFIRLNWMIALWNKKRWLLWHLLDVGLPLTPLQTSYTVGPGGDFNVAVRPPKLERAYSRLVNTLPSTPTDYQLRLIPSYEDYSKIVLKTQTNFPTHYFYDAAFPLGNVFFWPRPLNQLFEMHILVREQLAQFATLDTAVAFPPEYEPALELNLALWLRRAAKMPPDPELAMLARDALNTIRVNNTELAALDMPTALTRPSVYNILADEWH